MDKELLIDDILKEKANTEALSLPSDLNLKIKDTISKLPDRRKRKSKFVKGAAAAAIITVVTTTSLSAAFPAYARNMPIVNSIFKFLSEKNIIDKEYIEYSTELNLSRTSNNVKVTINSITYDGIDLSIVYTVESKEEMKSEPQIMNEEFKINGTRTSFGSGSTGDFINKNTYVGVVSYLTARDYLPESIEKSYIGGNVEIPENFLMDFSIKSFSNNLRGLWDFKFKVSSDKIADKVNKVKATVELPKLGKNLKVNEVIFTPIKTVLRTEGDNIQTNDMVHYMAFDDKGRYLPVKITNGDGDKSKIYWQYTYSNIYKDTKYVTFIPATRNKVEKEEVSTPVKLNLEGTTILSEDEFGEYRINKVEFLKDKTLIHYECTKYLAAMNPYGLVIGYDSNNAYKLSEDKVTSEGKGKFIAEIEALPKNKQYFINANNSLKQYDLREDMKFTINVK